jgi:hypothetical protein
MNIADPKGLDQAVRTLQQETLADPDDFKHGPLAETLAQFEAMHKFDKKMDSFFAQKRVDISEKLCFNRKQVTSTLRLFIDSEVSHQDEETAYLKLNVFGRLILNQKPDVSDSEYFSHYRNSLSFEKNFVKWFTFAENVAELKVEFVDEAIRPAFYGPTEKARRGGRGPENVNGFTIIRTIRKDQVQFPLTAKITMTLESQSQQFRLSSDLATFMRRNHATRREITDALYDYCRINGLLEGQSIRLDDTLRSLFRTQVEGTDSIPVHDLSSHIKLLVSDPEEFDFVYSVREDAVLRKYLDAYDLKINIPLELMPDLIGFYVSKLVLNEEERKRSLTDEHGLHLNPVIRSHEKVTQMHEQIARKILGLKAMLQRRDLFKQLAEDPTEYLDRYLKTWERSQEVQQKQGGGVLGKRPVLEENELLGLINDKYDVLLDKEIESYLKAKSL